MTNMTSPPRLPRWLVTAQRFGCRQRHIVYCGDNARIAAEARLVMQQVLDQRHPECWWLVSLYQIDRSGE